MNWVYRSSKSTDSPLETLLHQRDLYEDKEINQFLDPTYDDLNDPFLLPNVKQAVKRIFQAVEKKEKVVIYGDYDADGVTATSILWDFLYRQLNLEVLPFIPSRFDEGYGLNREALKKIKSDGADLVITVDCGVKDKSLIEEFKDLDFIVTDHHSLPAECEFGHIVVHPDLPGSKYPFKQISGAVVAWKLVHAIVNTNQKVDLDYKKYIDLAAIGSVCDVMPLKDENRVIVKLGLERMRETMNIGLSKLLEVTGINDKALTSFDIGYVIGPRINAAGRLGSALDAVRLFTTQNETTALKQAHLLNELNTERQQITMDMEEQAYASIGTITESQKLIFAYGKNWNVGIVGLVAGRLLEKYKRPIICATIIEDKVVGSARSIKDFNITNLLGSFEDLLLRFGGHELAAGFSLEVKNLDLLKNSLEAKASELLSDEDLIPSLMIDMKLTIDAIDNDLADSLEKFEPFGFGNPTPVFVIEGLSVKKKFYMGKDNRHLKLYLQKGGKTMEALAFNFNAELDKVMVNDTIDIACNIKINNWKGNKSIQLILQDFKLSK